ncbi:MULTISPECIES: DUF2946 family protein [Roseomonadaceae]|uniref:DUF2946 domain-containing protein n=1 Tax=Falsiroseomonas oleicola TaxID=2801474 RepID=A0ABS6H9W6_9PROT|nr:DUF2946 family protein [Roseomonas oleicola]MBU8545495.1 hypothetical protein [Roseomonas oleicola]
MSRLPLRALRLILALAFCLQSGLAMAHCARLVSTSQGQAQPFPMVICTSDGLVTMDMSGADGPDSPAQAMPDLCLACHVLPVAELPAPVAVAAPRLLPIQVLAGSAAALPPLGARAPPYRPTGPPSHS